MPVIAQPTIDRPDALLVQELGQYSAATIHEAQGRTGAVDSDIKPVSPSMSFCGPAFTVVASAGDNLMLQLAIALANPGDVIIVSAGQYAEAGSFGDVLANACKAKGIAAMVTDSGVRDTEDLKELGFPTFSRSICMKGTVKETIAPFGQTISFGGQIINPGDVVRGDADGIVVVKKDEVARAISTSAARVAGEEADIARFWEGKDTIEICGIADRLASKGYTLDEAILSARGAGQLV